ncbi:MAG: GNAT family N-acetyltransferase [Methanomassiliicoccales archaeon]|jgi:ribosomal protein S18 acetylase RimI-like enzyme
MSEVRFEPLRRKDIGPVVKMTRDNMSQIMLEAWGLEWSDETLLEHILDKHTYSEVARLGRGVVGYCTLDQVGDYIFVVSVQVRKDHQREGIGRALMQRIEDLALMWGMEGVELCVQKTNSGAKAFYENLNYRFVSRERNNLMMRKELAPNGSCAEGTAASPNPV